MSDRADTAADPATVLAREAVRAKLFEQTQHPVSVGRFELTRKIGEGGMGVVFAAHDPELDREVAVKLLRSYDGKSAERLLREARAMARLAHPNVVGVHEAGTAGEQVYLVMEFVRGDDLRRWLSRRRRPWRDVVPLLIDAAHGLASAHDAGLIHRDFKPENVLVTEEGRAKVADFGLARPARAGTGTSEEEVTLASAVGSLQTLTRTGAIVGTPAYLPPEALEGKAPDARGDQFSFCVAAYEALFGGRPFAGATLAQIVENMSRTKLTAPPADRKVPRALKRLLVRGLANDPDARHASMATLAGSLASLLGRRRRVAVGGVLAFGVGGLAFGVLRPDAVPAALTPCTGSDEAWAEVWNDEARQRVASAITATGSKQAPRVSTVVAEQLDGFGQRWRDAHHEACMATRVRGELSDESLDLRMTCLSGRRAHAAAIIESLGAIEASELDRAEKVVRRLPAVDICLDAERREWFDPMPQDPDLRERVRELKDEARRASVQYQLGRRGVAAELNDEVMRKADAVGYRPLMAEVRIIKATRSPPTKEVRDKLYDALYRAETAGFVEGQRMAWTGLANVHSYLGEFEAGQRAASHARAFIERTGNDPSALATLINAQAFAQVEQSNFERAIELGKEAVAAIAPLGEDHEAYGDQLASLGTLYTLAERNEDARRVYEQAYEVLVAAHGMEHATVAHMMMNLGRVSARLDDLPTSNEWYQRSLATFEATGSTQEPAAIFALNNLGQNYGDQGRYDEAIEAIDRALEMMIERVGPEHRWLVRMRRGLSEVYLDAGRTGEAIAECERALAIAEATFGDEHDETASTRRRLGRISMEAGDLARARPLLERALKDHARPEIPASHRAITEYWLFRALRDDVDQRARAIELARSAIPVLAVDEARQQQRAQELRDWLTSVGEASDDDR